MGRIKTYIKENWDGWPLHSLVAAVFMYGAYFWPMETMLVANTIWWPDREATQHGGYKDIWTLHVILEWALPVLVGVVLYFILT